VNPDASTSPELDLWGLQQLKQELKDGRLQACTTFIRTGNFSVHSTHFSGIDWHESSVIVAVRVAISI